MGFECGCGGDPRRRVATAEQRFEGFVADSGRSKLLVARPWEASHPLFRGLRGLTSLNTKRYKSQFLSTHAAVYNTFNVQRHLVSAQTHRALRADAMTTWRTAVAAA
jgi:hypothetical protein